MQADRPATCQGREPDVVTPLVPARPGPAPREFYREPEAVFWVYGFPLLMAVALGIAFRENPVEQIPVDVQAGPQADERSPTHCSGQSTAGGLTVSTSRSHDDDRPRRLRTGKTDLVVLVASDAQRTSYES